MLFIRDGEVFHQIYKGVSSTEEMYQKISDTLTLLAAGDDSRLGDKGPGHRYPLLLPAGYRFPTH